MSAFETTRRALESATSREFERLAEPVLRVLAPELRFGPELGDMDRAGVDAFEPAPHGASLQLAIQCKAAASPRFRKDKMIESCRKSINDFLKSGHKTERFVFVVNFWGKEEEIRKEIAEDLHLLGERSVARNVDYWTVAELIDHARERVVEHINSAAEFAATNLHLDALQTDFHLVPPLRQVPARFSSVQLSSRGGAEEQNVVCMDDFDPTDLAGEDLERRTVLLTGVFGAGKTTAVKMIASSSPRRCFMIPCRFLPVFGDSDKRDSRLFYRFILHHLGVQKRWGQQFDMVQDYVLEALRDLLERERSQRLVVFDGLDEHRFYCTSEGFRTLLELTSNFECPVVFTVRREFIESGLGRYESPLIQNSSRTAKVDRVELLPWQQTHILELISRVSDSYEGPRRGHARELMETVSGEAAQDLYGDLIQNPLLLSWLVEDVSYEGLRPLNRAEVVFNHIVRKLRRDRLIAERPGITVDANEQAWLGRVLDGIRLCASTLTAAVGERASPYRNEDETVFQSLSWEEVTKCFGEDPSGRPFTKDDVLGTGVFLQRALGLLDEPRVYFVLQVFHDFFIALCFEATFPVFDDSVVEAWREDIRIACEQRPSSLLAKYLVSRQRAWSQFLQGPDADA